MKYKYKKSYRTRKKRSVFNVFKNKFFWLGLLFFIILSGLTYLFIFSSFFQIKEIKISGNIKVSVEELRNNIAGQIDKRIIFFDTKSIFLTNLKKINKMLLEKFPQIAKVDLDREFPSSLLAQIEERKPVAIFSEIENYFFIDKEGIIFEKVSVVDPHTKRGQGAEGTENNEVSPRYGVGVDPQILKIKKSALVIDLELGKEIIGKEQLDQILKINSKLKDDLKIPIEEVLTISKKRINAKTSEGWEVYFNPERDLEWQLTELSILLKERIPPEKRRNIEYIDLRFEKIYIYPETYLLDF